MKPLSVVPIVALAILNGLFSPALALVFASKGLWYPWFMPNNLQPIFMLSSLIISTLTLMIGGVPAALYEKFSRQSEPTFASRMIWLVAVCLLTLPAATNMLKAFGVSQ